jgi:hypothetical protein
METHGVPLVYLFKGSDGPVVCVAPGESVLATFGSLAVFSAFFGGHMTFGWPPSAHLFLGVWGHRNASRFRRLLRERLGPLEIIHTPPPGRHTTSATTGDRLTPAERDKAERRIKQGWKSPA